MADLNTLVSEQQYQPFDMREVIKRIVDDGYFFETMGLLVRNMITGFAQFNRRPAGIIANQPMWAAGCIDRY